MSETQSYNDPVGEATLTVISKADKFNRWMRRSGLFSRGIYWRSEAG